MIIPSYNHEQFIVESIASVAQQDYRPLEILLIDDGSTDQTYELGLHCLRESDIPFLALKKKNQGSCVTGINLGLQRCHGTYVSILASDDIFLPGKLSESIEAINKHNSDISLAKVGIMRFDGTYIDNSETSVKKTEQSYRRDTLFQDLVSINGGFSLPYLGMVWRKSAFGIVGPYDPTILPEDYDMALRIAKAKLKIAFVYKRVAMYRVNAKSLDYNIRISEDVEIVLMKHRNDLGKGKRAILAYAKANRGISLRRKQPLKSGRLILNALMQYPPVGIYLLRLLLYRFFDLSKVPEKG